MAKVTRTKKDPAKQFPSTPTFSSSSQEEAWCLSTLPSSGKLPPSAKSMALQSSRLAGITLTALGPVQAGLAREKRKQSCYLPLASYPRVMETTEPLRGSAGFFRDYSELLLFSESEAMLCHPAALCHQGGYCTPKAP